MSAPKIDGDLKTGDRNRSGNGTTWHYRSPGSPAIELAKAARSKGEEPLIIRLNGQCDCLFEGFESVSLPVGKAVQLSPV